MEKSLDNSSEKKRLMKWIKSLKGSYEQEIDTNGTGNGFFLLFEGGWGCCMDIGASTSENGGKDPGRELAQNEQKSDVESYLNNKLSTMALQ